MLLGRQNINRPVGAGDASVSGFLFSISEKDMFMVRFCDERAGMCTYVVS